MGRPPERASALHMPAHFQPTLPGIVGDAQREARGEHDVVLRNECVGILTLVPELADVAVDAPAPNVDAKVVPYAFLAWL